MRSICYDPFVFLKFFYSKAWAEKVFNNDNRDVQLLARYAVAEERYLRYKNHRLAADTQELKIETRQLLKYLPCLALLNSPVPKLDRFFTNGQRLLSTVEEVESCSGETSLFQDMRREIGANVETRLIADMIFACGLLMGCPPGSIDSWAWNELEDHHFITCYTFERMTDSMRRQNFDEEAFHSYCLVGVGKLATSLHCTYPPTPDQDLETGDPRQPDHINPVLFSHFFTAQSPQSIPKPFEPDAVHKWKCMLMEQRQSRATSEYLDVGEWVGVYTYTRPRAAWDLPMQEIRFTTTDSLADGNVSISHATGRDQHGLFTITLTSSPTGKLQGQKRYPGNGVTWSWTLSNTPFGLYGVWTSYIGARSRQTAPLGGAVWLWKREWEKAR